MSMTEIILIIYCILGYWAINKIWYSRRTYIVHDAMVFYMTKIGLGILLGFILIPIALIMAILGK